MTKYRTIRNKTYNNVMYLSKIISKERGYPMQEAVQIALREFNDDWNDGRFRWDCIERLLNNLVTYEQYKINVYMHEYNMEGIH